MRVFARWPPMTVFARRAPLEVPGRLLALAAVLILAAAVLGFTIAHSANGGRGSPALNRHASNGPLQLSLAADWRPVTSPIVAQLGLSNGIAWAPSRPSGHILVIGRSQTADPQLLPRRLLASLPSVPTPQTVTLGSARFFRYLNLVPRGDHASESVYAMSTTIGTVLGLCVAPEPSTSFTTGCERSLGTLRLASGKALPPGPLPQYASALDQAIQRLNTVRTTAGSQLRKASAASAQAKAAYALAAAHAQAAAALSHLDAGPASAANATLATALKLTGAAYVALGHAASRQDPALYATARASLQRATSALNAAFSGLDAFGYSVS
jgi:hypothetical protein